MADMSENELTEREVALWDRGGYDIDFPYPVLTIAARWYPDVRSDREDVYDHIRRVALDLKEKDPGKYIAGTRTLDGRGEAAELTPEGGLELGGQLGLILNSRSKNRLENSTNMGE